MLLAAATDSLGLLGLLGLLPLFVRRRPKT
ncbi:MAG: GlyGly-CTERM sorting domain-containing protein [Planctomycetes bacterium]|nr:GlyGly-CTERM sorting domain-containing protein [Planctomycetota bacterium]